MDNLIKVRLVRVSHPKTTSSIRRLIYATLERGAVETPFGWVVLSDGVWKRLLDLNERAKKEIGHDVVIHIDVYLPREVLERWLEEASRKARNSTVLNNIKSVLETIRRGERLSIP